MSTNVFFSQFKANQAKNCMGVGGGAGRHLILSISGRWVWYELFIDTCDWQLYGWWVKEKKCLSTSPLQCFFLE